MPRNPSPPRSVAAVLALLVAVLGLSACGDQGQDVGDAAAAAQVTASLDDVQVRGEVGAVPTVSLDPPFSVPEFEQRTIVEGDGPGVTQGQQVTVEYLGVNGTDGTTFDSSFDRRETSTFQLGSVDSLLPGIVKAVEGATVGSRVLAAVPPSDGYGVGGMAALGIGPTDTLVFVVDVVGAKTVLTRAEGTPVPAKAGLPTVKLAADGAPTVTVPSGAAPASTVVQPLITGTGPKVAAGQTVTAHYTGVTWPGGRVFDSSWDRDEPELLTVGAGKLLAGLDAGLVGQTVGSQVMVVVPPDKGYGAEGNASAGITGTDTLVFVVDLLDASAAAPSR